MAVYARFLAFMPLFCVRRKVYICRLIQVAELPNK